MSTDKNFGLATPRVRILTELPRIVRKAQSYNFDVSAFQWDAINNSPFLSPLLTENVVNPEKTFAACFPSKRKFFVDNMLQYISPSGPEGTVRQFPLPSGATPSSAPSFTIFWTPVGPPPPPPAAGGSTPPSSTVGIINTILKEQEFPSYYDTIDVSNPVSRMPLIDKANPPHETATDDNYNGPRWNQEVYKEQAEPDDRKIVQRFRNFISGGSGVTITTPSAGGSATGFSPLPSKQPKKEVKKTSVFQSKVDDGLWWGIESSPFLTSHNMPFWVTMEFPKDPPSPYKFETLFVISLGISSTSNKDRYDLLLSPTRKPTLIDYYGVSGGGSGDEITREFDVDSSRLNFKDGQIDVGFMTAGGRLIIYVNDIPLVYTRIVKTGATESIGTMKEAKIRRGRIRVYGTNVAANIYAYPMTFAEQSAMAFPIANQKTVTAVGGPSVTTTIDYSAADEENQPTGKPVAILPIPAATVSASSQSYGIDAEQFIDKNGTLNITSAFGLHQEGKAEFFSASTIPSVPLGPLPSTDFFLLVLTPSSRSWLGGTLPHARTPYFFRLKGVDAQDRDGGIQIIRDATSSVISIKEGASAPDYFHIKKTATITLYNENGTWDYLKNRQQGVQIDWSWKNVGRKQTFTGVITSHDTSEVPGKETITIQCEDYNHILRHTPIVNSPFYDGMVGFHAVKDLAQRAGIKDFDKDWQPDPETHFFLPSGYSFSSPKVRFKSTDKIFDCIMNIVKRFEAYIYFDGSGKMHIDKLPGGLLGVPPELILISNRFSSNPLSGLDTILDQKNITIDFNSTFNQINLVTLDRDTRNPIMLGTVAKGAKDRLKFKKEYMVDQPAYGEKEVAKVHMDELSKRIFAPIRKTSFKTVGSSSILSPLEFVEVDGIPFRLMSISRSFNADTNDYTNEYEAEWLNG